MRKSSLLILFYFTAAICVNAQNHHNNEETKLRRSVTRFFDGFSELDPNIIKQYSTADLLLLEDGAVWNMDSIVISINRLKDQIKGAGFTRINHLDFIQTEVKGHSAWVAYHNTADLTFNNGQKRKLQWLESAFSVKEGNDWKIRLLHSTKLKPDNK